MFVIVKRHTASEITVSILEAGNPHISDVIPDYLLAKAEEYINACAIPEAKALAILVDAEPEPMLSVFMVIKGVVKEGMHFFGRHIASDATIEKRKLIGFLNTRSLNADTIEEIISKF